MRDQKEKKGGGEEEIQDSHSTPYLGNTDSSFICNSFLECVFDDLFSQIGQGRGELGEGLLPLYNRNKEP